MTKKSIYDDIQTFVIKEFDERLLGTRNFHFKDKKIDWDEVYKTWCKFAKGEIL